ncbi:MAG: arsenate reductase (glutaredoxin) [Alphaproteobacteria bacterium]|jgi:arsenate reductase|nr:arsenate reductase (glutaredoxin) [Alphaproteobacteria bacterium]
MAKLLHNPHSPLSRRALGLVEADGRGVEVIDVVEAVPEAAELGALTAVLPVEVRELLDHADALYFALGLDDPCWSETEVMAAAFDNPRLLRCPILIAGDGVRLGDDAVADRAAHNDNGATPALAESG